MGCKMRSLSLLRITHKVHFSKLGPLKALLRSIGILADSQKDVESDKKEVRPITQVKVLPVPTL